MKVNLLQISLLVVMLANGFTSLPARAECDQEELCEAQTVVVELLEDIVDQHEAIEAQWKTLGSIHGGHTLRSWYERTRRYVDVVSRYLRIGTLESRLLVANNKLGSVKVAMQIHDPFGHCSEKIQLSAGF